MKDSAKHHRWFKRRRYGYGWTPVTWQGWLTVILFLVAILAGAIFILKDTPRNTFSGEVVIFLGVVAIVFAVGIAISRITGPKPKWRWGKKSTDNPDEDF